MKLTRRSIDEVNGELYIDNPSLLPMIDGLWMRSEWDGKVKRSMQLYRLPPHSVAKRRFAISVHLTETKQKGSDEMRCVFTTTLSVDIDSADDALRAAFIQFVTENARTIYGPAAMLSKKAPELSLAMTSRNGRETLPVFPQDVNAESNDDD